MVSHHCIGDPTAMVAQQVPVKMHDDDARWVLPKKPHRGSFITAVSFIVAISLSLSLSLAGELNLSQVSLVNHPAGKVTGGSQSV